MEYSIIPPTKFDEVIDHLRHHFPDEPLNEAVGLCVQGQPCELLENHHIAALKEGMSLMAMDEELGMIAGVVINATCQKGETEEHLELLKTINNIAYQRIFGLLDTVNIEADLFAKYKVDKLFDVKILSVDVRHRGKGIAKELFARSERVAIEHGFKFLKVDATSYYTQKVCENFGLKVEKTVKYGDYKDENGKKIYNTESPHDYYKVMIKELPSKPSKG